MLRHPTHSSLRIHCSSRRTKINVINRATVSGALLLASALALANTGLEREVLAVLKEHSPQSSFEIVGPLEIRSTYQDEQESRIYLDNLSRTVPEDSAERETHIRAFVESVLRPLATTLEPSDRAQILPVVRDRGFLQLMPGGSQSELVSRSLSGPLMAFYVVDFADRIQYLQRDDLAGLGLSPSELHELAVSNFSGVIGEVTVEEVSSGVFTIDFDGDETYTSSFLFLDSFWRQVDNQLGDGVVISLPSRDSVFFFPEPDSDRLFLFQEISNELHSDSAYPITSQLFQRRNGVLGPMKSRQR